MITITEESPETKELVSEKIQIELTWSYIFLKSEGICCGWFSGNPLYYRGLLPTKGCSLVVIFVTFLRENELELADLVTLVPQSTGELNHFLSVIVLCMINDD